MIRGERWLVAAGLVATLALSSCGDDGAGPKADATVVPSVSQSTGITASPTTTAKPTPDLPACEKLWIAGRQLEAPYRGCLQPDGKVSKSIKGCVGRQLAQYGDTLYAIVGREIMVAEPDRAHNDTYNRLLVACTG